MTIETRSLAVWLTAFFAYELCAHFHAPRWVFALALGATVCFAVWAYPILTLSSTVWGGERWWHPLSDAVIVLGAVLIAHLRWHLSASYLILVGTAIAAATLLHWLLGGQVRQ